MYVPNSFRVDDPVKLHQFIESNSFGTLVSCVSGVPVATHLPLLPLSEDGGCMKIVSHMARANRQWQFFSEETEVLAVFNGPHAYISPTYYTVDQAVPTWNYAAVHVYGYPKVIDEHDRIVSILMGMIEFYERSREAPWPGILNEEYRDRMIQAIVAFEISVTRIEGQFKLGQNRSEADIQKMYATLSRSKNPSDQQLASMMESERVTRMSVSQAPSN